MIEDANYFGMDMEITRVGDTYICENITTDVEKVTKMVDAYNAQAKPKQQVSIKDLKDYAREQAIKIRERMTKVIMICATECQNILITL